MLAIRILLFLSAVIFINSRRSAKSKRIIILVLGRIDQSPRMQYHALSFAKQGWKVDLVGYQDKKGPGLFQNHPNIQSYAIPTLPGSLTFRSRLSFLLVAPVKILHQLLSILFILFKIKQASYFLVQNPPSIPTFLLGHVLYLLRGTRFVIDWHNFGYTILALKLGKEHPFVKLLRIYERVLAKGAFLHITVSYSMQQVLLEWGIRPCHVCYDRPPAHFQPVQDATRKSNLHVIPEEFNPEKEKLLVTSTSWTPDENIYALWDALKMYNETRNAVPLLVLVTGKGPGKPDFVKHLQKNPLGKVRFCLPWFSSEDYPRAIACADFGVSLHQSSSGHDLPMKVVDLFGCGVPVVAWNFPAISELVHDHKNGFIANDSNELFKKIELLCSDEHVLQSVRQGAFEESKNRWDDEWNKKIPRLFTIDS
ncbi:mannosyltransferase complex subunit Alg1 [Schizosaccharomyces cryophilus OY26]|uniref:Chitobiosyldiphosphodolichol beta-mannosyltransferase n=1 Tax=Schizosaccharomyces cryophilus (strain OY26 / ATCC MYA-4695 / CBS 11777 / NBRC 106824 / NRRL Y48691) TaxID=653667 RepID=S9X137_SCHCR|nr:mannosyltransferase complex subunit Alg1 [Schizosaccharomyces cryophilus OY26]EPY50797.1 mannosyltransferase complex subunit Alg1 [Schizosaccharomyces cryophilus OY26]